MQFLYSSSSRFSSLCPCCGSMISRESELRLIIPYTLYRWYISCTFFQCFAFYLFGKKQYKGRNKKNETYYWRYAYCTIVVPSNLELQSLVILMFILLELSALVREITKVLRLFPLSYAEAYQPRNNCLRFAWYPMLEIIISAIR